MSYLVSVECAIEYDGRFLIIQRPIDKHAGGLLAFPGGTVDENDHVKPEDILRNAARREVFEEVGFTLSVPLTYVTSNYFVGSHGMNVIHTIFYGKLDALPNIIPSEQEVPHHAWMTIEEINKAKNAPVWLKGYIALIKGL